MANLGSPERENLQEFESGAPENAESLEVVSTDLSLDVSDLDTPKDTLESAKRSLSRSEVHPSLRRNNLKRKAPWYHKGVHLKQSNNKFVARLCLPGEKKKLELGEYQSHDEAARAYDVGAFYYQRLDCKCADRSFQDKLPRVPDDVCEERKRTWVRVMARQFASSLDSERRTSASDRALGSGCSSLFTSPLEGPPTTPALLIKLGCNYSSPASFGTQEASFGNPTEGHTPGTSVSDTANFFSGRNENDVEHSLEDLDVTSMDRRNRKAAPHIANDTTWCIPTSSPVSRRSRLGLTNLEEQQERNADQTLSADKGHSQQAVPQLKMTDSILFAQCELRKQGWVLILKPSSAKTGLLFSLPQGQHAPALLITDIIINSFYELREQGWEVHLEASKRDNIECRENNHRGNSSKSSNSSDIPDAEGLAPPIAAASPRSLARMNMSPSSNAGTPLSSPKCSIVLPDHDAAVIMPNFGNFAKVFREGNSNNYPLPQLDDTIKLPWWDWP